MVANTIDLLNKVLKKTELPTSPLKGNIYQRRCFTSDKRWPGYLLRPQHHVIHGSKKGLSRTGDKENYNMFICKATSKGGKNEAASN